MSTVTLTIEVPAIDNDVMSLLAQAQRVAQEAREAISTEDLLPGLSASIMHSWLSQLMRDLSKLIGTRTLAVTDSGLSPGETTDIQCAVFAYMAIEAVRQMLAHITQLMSYRANNVPLHR